MWYLSKKLEKAGFIPYLFNYPSRRNDIQSTCQQLMCFIKSHNLENSPISFVGHSLGGVIAWEFTNKLGAKLPIEKLITIGSPLAGSQTARRLSKFKFIRWLMGPALEELASFSVGERRANLKFCSIAGYFPLRCGYYGVLNDKNDGVVTISETEIQGTSDHIVVNGTHSLLVYKRRVIDNTINFLRSGKFL